MIEPATHRARGRPRDLEKRAALLREAERLFLTHSVAGVSMESVAAAAGVSKMTLYSHFPDRESLFEAVVASVSQRMISEMARVHAAGGELSDSLAALGVAFLTMMLRKDVVQCDRSLMVMLAANPGMAKRFYEAGPASTVRSVAAILADAHAAGLLRVDDPLEAAADLLSLWQGDLFRQMTLGLRDGVGDAAIAERVRQKIALFLRAYSAG
jgi:TetR/AcrR family transcriptional repressor of mexJK operon